MFGLEAFKLTTLGEEIGHLLRDPKIIAAMIKVSRDNNRTPAVLVLGPRIEDLRLPVSAEDRKAIGKLVREVMEAHGWTTDIASKNRLPKGHVFGAGAVYYPSSSADAGR